MLCSVKMNLLCGAAAARVRARFAPLPLLAISMFRGLKNNKVASRSWEVSAGGQGRRATEYLSCKQKTRGTYQISQASTPKGVRLERVGMTNQLLISTAKECQGLPISLNSA